MQQKQPPLPARQTASESNGKVRQADAEPEVAGQPVKNNDVSGSLSSVDKVKKAADQVIHYGRRWFSCIGNLRNLESRNASEAYIQQVTDEKESQQRLLDVHRKIIERYINHHSCSLDIVHPLALLYIDDVKKFGEPQELPNEVQFRMAVDRFRSQCQKWIGIQTGEITNPRSGFGSKLEETKKRVLSSKETINRYLA